MSGKLVNLAVAISQPWLFCLCFVLNPHDRAILHTWPFLRSILALFNFRLLATMRLFHSKASIPSQNREVVRYYAKSEKYQHLTQTPEQCFHRDLCEDGNKQIVTRKYQLHPSINNIDT